MKTAAEWAFRALVAALLLGAIGGCALNDGGIVGTGNRPDCQVAGTPGDTEACKRERSP